MHLQNANLAHSCLRESATEYLFRDMTLTHVLLGASCNLEIFAVTKENAHLLKYVKHIVVQVPPAIAWEIGIDGTPDMYRIGEYTHNRLCRKFGVSSVQDMSEEQVEYCRGYHEAMVTPFTDERPWYAHFRNADSIFPRIFRHFVNLTAISVGCRERIDMPRPSLTKTFMLQYGTSVLDEVHPLFVEDSSTSKAWASASTMRCAPSSVRSLELTMASVDDGHPLASINSLLGLNYRHELGGMQKLMPNITRLSLSIHTVLCPYIKRELQGDTQSAQAVSSWATELNNMPSLQHLDLTNVAPNTTGMTVSDTTKPSVLPLLLPTLALTQLSTLKLHNFTLSRTELQDALNGTWPGLRKIRLDNVQLWIEPTTTTPSEQHTEWIDACTFVLLQHPGVRLELHRTGMTTDAALSSLRIQQAQYADDLSRIPRVVLIP